VGLLWKAVAVEELAENCTAEAQGQFGNPGEGEYEPSEAVTRVLVKTLLTEKT
jgi:hypothetical protein